MNNKYIYRYVKQSQIYYGTIIIILIIIIIIIVIAFNILTYLLILFCFLINFKLFTGNCVIRFL